MCFTLRRSASKCISFLSLIAAIAGIMMIVFSFMLTSNDLIDQMSKEEPDIKDGTDLIFMMLLIFSLVVIGISVLGFFFWCCHNRCFACVYGTILLPVWIIVTIIGGLAVGIANAASDTIEEECLNLSSEISQSFEDSQAGADNTVVTITLDVYDAIYINEYMCSSECPCPATAQ